MDQLLKDGLQYGLPLLMGVIVSFIQGRPFSSWDISDKLKDVLCLLIAVIASFIGGFATVLINAALAGTELTWAFVFASSWPVLISSQAFFKLYFKDKI